MASPVPIASPQDTPSSQDATQSQKKSSKNWFSPRVVLLALLFAPLTAYWSADQLLDAIFSLMIPPVVMTMFVSVANLIVGRFAPKLMLNEGELLLFYAMQAIVGAISAEWMWVINPYIHSYALYSSNDSRFTKYILPNISHWFFVSPDKADLFTDYRNGGRPFWYFLSRLHLWAPYITSWTIFVGLICTAMLCINSLMRDQWTNREKLSFPIIQMPMAIVQVGAGKSKIYRSRWFWVPFLVMLVIDINNGIHFIRPSIPLINVRYIGAVNEILPNPPWSAMGWTPIGIFPYISVIGFFMPTDLLFSCIFFFFMRKLVQVITYALGYTESAGVFGGGGLIPGPPYFSEQSWGAFLALFCTALWVARGYIKEVWQKIVRGGNTDPRHVPHRFAFAGLVLSLGGVTGIGLLLGIPLWMLLIQIGLFLMFSVALTRMRGQIGAPSHEMAFMGPNQLMVDFIGTKSLPEAGIARMVPMFFIFNRLHRTHPMPHQLEAMKMGDIAKISQRAVFAGILIATILGSVLAHFVYIQKGYRFAATRAGGDTAGVVATLIERKLDPNPWAVLFVGVGFSVVLALDAIRFRIPSFPLHPAGYALAMNFGLDYFWFGLTIVWVIKMMSERYYGLKAHSCLHRLALGIIAAEYFAETIWATYTMITQQATYSVSINGRLGWDK